MSIIVNDPLNSNVFTSVLDLLYNFHVKFNTLNSVIKTHLGIYTMSMIWCIKTDSTKTVYIPFLLNLSFKMHHILIVSAFSFSSVCNWQLLTFLAFAVRLE